VLCVRIRKRNSNQGNLFEFDAKLSIRENVEDSRGDNPVKNLS
jgi:hypothetical protein